MRFSCDPRSHDVYVRHGGYRPVGRFFVGLDANLTRVLGPSRDDYFISSRPLFLVVIVRSSFKSRPGCSRKLLSQRRTRARRRTVSLERFGIVSRSTACKFRVRGESLEIAGNTRFAKSHTMTLRGVASERAGSVKSSFSLGTGRYHRARIMEMSELTASSLARALGRA